eukprot:TRINITY_DN1371_c0_g1_i5.p1 TRINITY_DN1371_c0_g1~~TRINITY_DN1371_c0_g1_i5.p1  ORF type:complete len:1087 (+),score=330.68 TRINITY_DN1371_c0_g1_i5:98-3358(+)
MASPEFENLISMLLSPDNNIRGPAEATYNTYKRQPDALIASLVAVLTSSNNDGVKMMSAVLLRRVIGKSSDSLLPVLQADTIAVLKQKLLQAIETEKISTTRKKLEDAISELAMAVFASNGQWTELLPFLFKCSTSADADHRTLALNIFSDLAVELGPLLRPYFGNLKQILGSGLADPASFKVQIAALTATVHFLQVLTEAHERQQFQSLIPVMLGIISATLNAKQEEDARAALELFVGLVDMDPLFLKPYIEQIVTAMQQIATAQGLDDTLKQLGVEFLVSLTESKPGLAKKLKNYVQTLIHIILQFMLELDDDPHWGDPTPSEVDRENADYGEEALDRVSLALGGKSVIPILFGFLPSLMSHPDWKYRHTALLSISIVGEGCRATMETNLAEIVKSILPFFQDPHPRVRWAACNTCGQMSTDFGPEFQNKFHAEVLGALMALMDDVQNPRVQSHAASSIINFCENAEQDALKPYLEPLLAKLMQLLHVGTLVVREQAVTAIASIADCSQEQFVPYYSKVMPYLKNMLGLAAGKELKIIRGKLIECITLIGVAVGRDVFAPDANSIMEMILQIQNSNDDTQGSLLLQAWSRICRCLGKDFVQYLQYVMPPLLKSAKINPDVVVRDDDQDVEQEGWDFIPIGDKRIGINTSALEEKSTACSQIYSYVSELEEGFFPYVDEVTKFMVPLMRFYYHDGVRSAAFMTIPCLLVSATKYMQSQGAAKGADITYARNFFNFAFPTLLDAFKDEVDMDILILAIDCLKNLLEALGENPLTEDQLQKILAVNNVLFGDIESRKKERSEQAAEEDVDEEEQDKLADDHAKDQEIIAHIADLVGHIAKWQKVGFMGFFHQMAPKILELLDAKREASDQQAALCIWDDVVDFQKELALPYYDTFLPYVIQYIGSPDPSVRQAAVYGIGSACEVGGDKLPPQLINEILSRLSQVIVQQGSRQGEMTNPTENAIAAVGKLILHQSKAIDCSVIVPTWLTWLPVLSDKVESKVTYAQLCTMIEQNNPHLLGQNYANVPRIVSIFAEIFETELIDAELTKRIVNILKGMQSALPAELLSASYSVLTPTNQQKLTRVLQSN